MNCSDLESLARRRQLRQRLGDAEVLTHLRQCGACEALYASGQVGSLLVSEADTDVPFDLEAMRSELEQALQAEARDPAARLRGLSTPWRSSIVGGVILLTVGLVAAIGLRANWNAYPETRMWLTLGAFLVLLLVTLGQLFRPLTLIEKPSHQRAALLGAVGLPAVFALIPHEAALWAAPAEPGLGAVTCVLLGLVLTLPSAVCVFLGLRSPMNDASGSEPRSLWLAAGALGLIGNLTLQVHCALTTRGHLLFGHASLSVVWFVGLWVWSRRVRRPV